jgi:hypothetical protein
VTTASRPARLGSAVIALVDAASPIVYVQACPAGLSSTPIIVQPNRTMRSCRSAFTSSTDQPSHIRHMAADRARAGT